MEPLSLYWSLIEKITTQSAVSANGNKHSEFSATFIPGSIHRVTELIQYNHVMHTASSTYIWDNIYTYDREFKVHLSHYPQRSWAAILQQAWSMYLKDKIPQNHNYGQAGHGFKLSPSSTKSSDTCCRFNKGKCTNRVSCKYEHKCDKCGKFGHGAHICRKRLAKLRNKSNGSGPAGVQESSK